MVNAAFTADPGRAGTLTQPRIDMAQDGIVARSPTSSIMADGLPTPVIMALAPRIVFTRSWEQ